MYHILSIPLKHIERLNVTLRKCELAKWSSELKATPSFFCRQIQLECNIHVCYNNTG
jgi:hypothetical protein